jgi:hypothetical protein
MAAEKLDGGRALSEEVVAAVQALRDALARRVADAEAWLSLTPPAWMDDTERVTLYAEIRRDQEALAALDNVAAQPAVPPRVRTLANNHEEN